MPSPMSAHNNDDEANALSNEEIETLYDIVRHAQTLPGPPLRALFDAYDHVKKARNESDDGSHIFTFILRMQEDRGEDDLGGHEGKEEGLVDRFVRVLGKMNIQIEIDPEGEGVEVTGNLPTALDNAPVRAEGHTGQRTQRRGSFDSFLDGAADKVPGIEYGQELPIRSRRASGAASDIGDRRDKRRSRSDSEARSHVLGQLPIRGRVNGDGNRRTASDNVASRPRRSASMSSRGSLRIHRDGHTGTQQIGDDDADDSEHTDSFDRSHIQIPGVNAPIPGAGYEQGHDQLAPVLPSRPSDTQVVRDAETFDYHRILAIGRTGIQKWRDQARTRRENREQMDFDAIAFDRNVLLKASLDSWRVALQTKRQTIETEHFFERLESRANKARNLFLLTKAFTHWAKSAEDEVQRTSTARRHILRTKYFNAWRDITAVNELKIQHFTLGKFLDKWRTRTATVREQNHMAINLYEHNIVYKLYWQWFWKFGDRRAPILHRNRLARDTIRKWAEIVEILKERETWAIGMRDHEIGRRALGKLSEKVAIARSTQQQADEFRRRSLLSSYFYALRKKSRLAPLYDRVKARIDERVGRSTFQAWHRDTRLSRQAKEVDRMRVVRNAFTAWNDRLRIKAVEERIDDRLQLQCLYKWALASRVSLFQRIHNHRLKGALFSTWTTKAQDREASLANAEQRFADFKKAQSLRTCLRRVENATVQKKNQEHLALSTYEPKLKQRVLDKLLEKHEHYQQLDNWAERANYYVTAKNAIRRWQRATEYARRNRRRETYAQVRRKFKMNLVRRTFGTWKERAAQIVVQERQANEMMENRVLRFSTHLLAQWRDRTAALRDVEVQALQLYSAKLTTLTLATWTSKSRQLQTLESKAVSLRQISTEIVAASCLKKLGWRLWNVRRREDDARALYERNFEKHVRAMVRFWWEQTSERLAQRPVSPTPSSRHRGGRRDDDDEGHYRHGHDGQTGLGEDDLLNDAGDETQRLEAWTAFDEHALGLSNTNLDLSFSISPSQPASQSRPLPPRRPYTQPPPSSAIRPPPIPELPDLENEEDEPGFWTSTPMPPSMKPGYLKTPSKRSVARAKRPELPANPEKRPLALGMSIDRATAGAASAPPVPGYRTGRTGGGVTSFERRLREGGFVGAGGSSRGGRGGGGGGGKRVGFGDLGQR